MIYEETYHLHLLILIFNLFGSRLLQNQADIRMTNTQTLCYLINRAKAQSDHHQ